ncbi:MAG: mannose-1-phosphate guanylyltransferase [Spirochaetes bacterium]|nr:mannose-1-phosphate guanylyltransferase [Spirochaetota bacterium]
MPLKVIIMAGGRGERFWPRSRRARPKQFARIISDETMLLETMKRFAGLVPVGDIFVSIGASQVSAALAAAPGLTEANLIIEPMARDTAAAVALATLAAPVDDDDVLYFAPADHHIADRGAFQADIRRAADTVVREGAMTVLGIRPTHAATDFGYVRVASAASGACPVEAFREKPDAPTAASYLAAGNYLWNAGMFLFTRRILTDLLERHAPEHLSKIREYLARKGADPKGAEAVFASIPRISFDYAIAEKAEKIFCVPAAFPWDDVGSWGAVSRLRPHDEGGNVVEGEVVHQGSRNCVVLSNRSDLTVVLNHVSDLNVVVEDGVVYVSSRAEEGRVKELLKTLETRKPSLL